MKRLALMLLFVLILVFSAQACGLKSVRGSGNVVEQERQVSGFNKIKLSDQGTVYVEFGDSEALLIEAEDNLLEYLESEVEGDTLKIGVKERVNLRPKEPINFYVTLKKLDALDISGSGKMQVPEISVTSFSIDISGSGDVDMTALYAASLDVEISGSGKVDIEGGEVEDQDIDISGSGRYNARDVQSGRTKIEVSGSGEATVRVRDHLEVDVSGSGDVRYLGAPTVDEDVSGSGDVEHIGE